MAWGKSSALCRTPAAGRQGFIGRHGWLIVLSWSILSCSRVAGPYVAPTWRLVVIPGGPVIACCPLATKTEPIGDRKSTRLNSSHVRISYAVFCLKKKKNNEVYEQLITP